MSPARLRESIFPNVPPFLVLIGPNERYDDGDECPEELVIHWTVAQWSSNTVRDTITRFGARIIEWTSADWGKHPGPAWDMIIVGDQSHPVDFSSLDPGIRLNKFPTTNPLCRKDLMWNNFKAMQKKYGRKYFAFMPETYNYPAEARQLKLKIKKYNNTALWICKPPRGSQGNGIILARNLKEIPDRISNTIVQRYITNPLLINGLKFDLRIYVLLTSVDPVKLYIYEDGLVRLATEEFSLEEEHLKDKFRHLTNYSVNKNNENFEYNESPEECVGHKWSLKTFWKYLEEKGVDWRRVWRRIKNTCVKTFMCGHSDILQVFRKEASSDYSSFKLFGVDFFLDENMKPWLLELNNFPSMEKASLDRWVNDPMIAETYNVVGFHYTGKPTNKQRQALLERYHLQSPLDFEPKLYTRVKTEEQLEKEEYYSGSGLDPEEYLDMVSDEDLTPRDVRTLIRAEEELSQCHNYTRIFPSPESTKFLTYMNPPSYSDYLLDAWEIRYAEDRETGRNILKQKCYQNVHLKK